MKRQPLFDRALALGTALCLVALAVVALAAARSGAACADAARAPSGSHDRA